MRNRDVQHAGATDPPDQPAVRRHPDRDQRRRDRDARRALRAERGRREDRAAAQRDRDRDREEEAVRPQGDHTARSPRRTARRSTRTRPRRRRRAAAASAKSRSTRPPGTSPSSGRRRPARSEHRERRRPCRLRRRGPAGQLRLGRRRVGEAENDAKIRTASGDIEIRSAARGKIDIKSASRRRRGRHPPRLDGLHRRELDERRHVVRAGRERRAAGRVRRPERRLPRPDDERRREGAPGVTPRGRRDAAPARSSRWFPPLLRENVAFRRFFAGQFVSLVGDQVSLHRAAARRRARPARRARPRWAT